MNKIGQIKNDEIIIFKTEDEKISVDVRFEEETTTCRKFRTSVRKKNREFRFFTTKNIKQMKNFI